MMHALSSLQMRLKFSSYGLMRNSFGVKKKAKQTNKVQESDGKF